MKRNDPFGHSSVCVGIGCQAGVTGRWLCRRHLDQFCTWLTLYPGSLWADRYPAGCWTFQSLLDFLTGHGL